MIPGNANSGGDNPYFIASVMGWMRRNASLMAYEAYFEETEPYCHCALSQNPKARAEYVRQIAAITRR